MCICAKIPRLRRTAKDTRNNKCSTFKHRFRVRIPQIFRHGREGGHPRQLSAVQPRRHGHPL